MLINSQMFYLPIQSFYFTVLTKQLKDLKDMLTRSQTGFDSDSLH